MLKDVLTPHAACELFGKSTEAVRRAVSEKHVKTPIALQFGSKPIHLLDLESAKAYWARGPRAAYMEEFDGAVDRMRGCGITFTDEWGIDYYRILHPFPLAFDPAKHPRTVEPAD